MVSLVRTLSGSSVLNINTFNSGTSFQMRIAVPWLTASKTQIQSGSTTYKSYDTEWVSSFPFETKYRSLLRLKQLTNFLVQNYTIRLSETFDANIADEIAILAEPKVSNIFCGEILFMETNRFSNWGNPKDYVRSQLTEMSKSNALTQMGLANTDLLSKTNYISYTDMPPSLKEVYKMYFGTGRRTFEGDQEYVPIYNSGKIPTFRDFYVKTAGTESQDGTARIVSRGSLGPTPAGWKYGLYSALPTNTTVTFRRNKFGQFRDMLEQRLYMKYLLSKKNTISGPITVTFISGTDSYVTSTNDSTLNVRDSGIYSRDYTSGRPFSDDL